MRIILLAGLILTLSACSTWNSWMGKTDSVKEEPVACMPVFVPAEVASKSISAGDGPMDLRGNANLVTGKLKCDTDKDKFTQTVAVKITAAKGPALKGADLPVGFFAAVVAPDGTVIAKKQYQTTFKFTRGELKADEEQTLTFNLNRQEATHNNIYIGLSETDATIQ